jgi:gamma-glutamyl phosphate reductase
MSEVASKAIAARKAALKLANIPVETRNSALSKIAAAISENRKALLAANSKVG